jgi:hypothetical protein
MPNYAKIVQIGRVDPGGESEVSNGDLISNDELLGRVCKKSLVNSCEPLSEGGAKEGLEELWLGSLVREFSFIVGIYDVT